MAAPHGGHESVSRWRVRLTIATVSFASQFHRLSGLLITKWQFGTACPQPWRGDANQMRPRKDY